MNSQKYLSGPARNPPTVKILPKQLLLILGFLVPVLLTACAPVINKEQTNQTEWLTLEQGNTIGQTFVASYDGLSGIQISVTPLFAGSGIIYLHLRTDPVSNTDIANSETSISNINSPGIYSFNFTPQNNSRRLYYYVMVEIKGGGGIQVGAAGGDTYLNGAQYTNSTPQDDQLSFRLMYSMPRLGLGLVKEFATWGGVLAVGVFLFLLPGWGLLRLFWPGWDALNSLEKIGLSSGASLAIYPIFMLWTGLVGLHIGLLYAWIPPVAAICILIWYNRKLFTRNSTEHTRIPRSVRTVFKSLHLPHLSTLVLLVVIAGLIFTRFWSILAIDIPMWGDSYQHTVITQLIVDHHGLFRSWQPYADLQTFTYHFGFHSAAAVFHWITGLSIPRSVLWVGQLMNILAIICLYPLAMKLSRNRWSGVVTMIVAGLLAPVPMDYANWGRYTQLAGQIILASAVYLFWSMMAQHAGLETATLSPSTRNNRKGILLTILVIGGLALTHYRVLIFAILFLVAIYIVGIFSRPTWMHWKSLLLNTTWIGLGGGIIFLPWFINVFGGKILFNLSSQLTTPANAIPVDLQSYNFIGNLTQYLPITLWLLLPLAIAWGLWKQHKGVVLISLWAFLLLVAANPAWLKLPGTGAVNNFTIFIAIYMPASILIGSTAGMLMERFFSNEWRADLSVQLSKGWKASLLRLGVVGVQKNSRGTNFFEVGVTLLLVGISVVGVRQRLYDLQPERYALVTRPDLRAASWVKDNLPSDANLLVNSFFAYGGTVIVGSDGGWWLPVLAERHTTLPPINYVTEVGLQVNYVQTVNTLAKAIQDKGLTNPDVLAMLKDAEVTQVYIGQRQGRVNYNGPVVLDPRQLAGDPHFREVYHQDRVWIFEVN